MIIRFKIIYCNLQDYINEIKIIILTKLVDFQLLVLTNLTYLF